LEPRRSASLAPLTSTRDYAKQRVQFGRPIIENQAIAFALADMKTEIDAVRL
jgi:alkylation response protein AidB-like acyl-CoA dehydrogenase